MKKVEHIAQLKKKLIALFFSLENILHHNESYRYIQIKLRYYVVTFYVFICKL